MRLPLVLVTLAAAGVAAAACGGQQAEETPPPVVVDTTPRVNQDSIDAANRARAEAEARARAEAERRAAAERAAREREALMSELAAMIHFDYDKSDIRSDDMANLDRKAAILNANPNLRIQISGHADERGSDEYNLALGNRRAGAAKRYLVSKGISDGRIDIRSFGEEQPAATGSDESAWQQNRRDEFQAVAGGETLVAPR
jgi:peptidoglycan-associated lipoprotein